MKKFLALTLAALMLVSMFALAGCGKTESGNEPADTAADTEAAADTVLTMATNASFPPYEFVGDDGNFAGIDVEVAGKIAEKLGMTLEIVDTEFGSIIGGVQEGK